MSKAINFYYHTKYGTKFNACKLIKKLQSIFSSKIKQDI